MLIEIQNSSPRESDIDRCCLRDPSGRYHSVSALRQAMALRRYLPVAAATVIFAISVLAQYDGPRECCSKWVKTSIRPLIDAVKENYNLCDRLIIKEYCSVILWDKIDSDF